VLMVTLFVEGLQFHAYHGVPESERAIGHRYSVDLLLTLADTPVADDIEATVDYVEVMKLVQQEATGRQFKTVEALASFLSDRVLEAHQRVIELTVRVAKLAPPAPYIVDAVGVEITRRRED
jgi:7,8-dihydroneopterin aldolase/epimerase/oxygenase